MHHRRYQMMYYFLNLEHILKISNDFFNNAYILVTPNVTTIDQYQEYYFIKQIKLMFQAQGRLKSLVFLIILYIYLEWIWNYLLFFRRNVMLLTCFYFERMIKSSINDFIFFNTTKSFIPLLFHTMRKNKNKNHIHLINFDYTKM